VRRPLLAAIVLACAVSLMTSGRLSLRLAASAALNWSFVPLLQIAGLAAVWPWKRAPLPFAEAIDRFFASQTIWSLWLCAFTGVWAFVPTGQAYTWTTNIWYWYGPAIAVGLAAAWVDYRFFRAVSGRGAVDAVRDLAVERAIVWTFGIAWFVGPSAWQVIAARLGL
jgi:hypothetical protein